MRRKYRFFKTLGICSEGANGITVAPARREPWSALAGSQDECGQKRCCVAAFFTVAYMDHPRSLVAASAPASSRFAEMEQGRFTERRNLPP
jgi:hypothetical protein